MRSDDSAWPCPEHEAENERIDPNCPKCMTALRAHITAIDP